MSYWTQAYAEFNFPKLNYKGEPRSEQQIKDILGTPVNYEDLCDLAHDHLPEEEYEKKWNELKHFAPGGIMGSEGSLHVTVKNHPKRPDLYFAVIGGSLRDYWRTDEILEYYNMILNSDLHITKFKGWVHLDSEDRIYVKFKRKHDMLYANNSEK